MAVVVHADDFGRTRGVTDTILETIDRGVVTSVSILVNGAAYTYALEAWRQRPQVALALHFNLVEGKAVASLDTVSSLVDRAGNFIHTPISLALAYLRAGRHRRSLLRDQVRAEFVAQLNQLTRDCGAHWSIRVDSHQHVHMLPWIFREIVEELSVRRTSVAHIRVVAEPLYITHFSRQNFRPLQMLGGYLRVGVMNLLAKFAQRELRRHNLPTTKHFVGFLTTNAMTAEAVHCALAAASPMDGDVEMLFHPGQAQKGEEHLFAGVREGVRRWYFSAERAAERAVLLRDQVRSEIVQFSAGTFRPRGWQATLSKHLGEVLRFGVTGGLAATVHLSILWLLTEQFGVWYVSASAVGFATGFAVSFTLQKFWTFKELNLQSVPRQATQFFLLQLGGLSINVVGVYLMVEYWGVWYMLAQFILLILVAVSTYLLSKFVIFKIS